MGPMFSLPFKKVTLDFDFQGGITLTQKNPSELTKYYNNGDIDKTIKERGKGWALGANFGLGLRYTLTKKLALYTNTKLLFAVPTIKTKVNSLHNNNLANSTTEKYEQGIVHWIVGFGIAYQVVR